MFDYFAGVFSQIMRSIYILFLVFAVLTLIFNFNARLPRFKWDFVVDKFGFTFYIPAITSIAVSVLISIFASNFFFK